MSYREGPIACYRLKDAAGRLLYVGTSWNPDTRFARHAIREWWPDVAERDIRWHDTLADALADEAHAFGNESPLHNRMVGMTYVSDPDSPEDYIGLFEGTSGRLTSDESAARLGITRRTLFNLASTRDDFPTPIYVGRNPLWLAEHLDAWRANHPARKKRAAA